MNLGSNLAGAKSASEEPKELDTNRGYKKPLKLSSVEPKKSKKNNKKVQKEAIESFIDNAFVKLLK